MQAIDPMSAAPASTVEPWFPSNASNREWAVLSARAPQLAATMRRYLLQLTTFLAPRSVEIADATLRQLARWLTTETDVTVVNRDHPNPRRGLQGVARRPARPGRRRRRWRRTPNGTGCG